MAITNRVYSVGDRPAELWAVRSRALAGDVRAALGECVTVLLAARRRIMNDTIYNRGLKPPGRFTNRLRNSERPYRGATRASVVNNATSKGGYRYADRRHNMRGYSRRYQARKESFWATKALRETQTQRNRIIRQALRNNSTRK